MKTTELIEQMKNNNNPINVHYIINQNGYDLTQQYKGSYPVVRKSALFKNNAHKMLIKKGYELQYINF